MLDALQVVVEQRNQILLINWFEETWPERHRVDIKSAQSRLDITDTEYAEMTTDAVIARFDTKV